MVTSKINNYEYAPGIATYGVEGKQGSQGQAGTSLFYTSFDIYNNASEVAKMGALMNGQYLPIQGTTQKIGRAYRNGDYVFDAIGNIYVITDIDALCSGNNGVYSKYMKLCGKIQQTSGDSYFDMNSAGRLKINSEYTGLDIVSSDSDLNYDLQSGYALRLISDKVTDGNVEFLRLNAVYGQNLNDTLDVYYDTAMNVYHVTADGPILVDAELMVADDNQSAQTTYDGYSPALCSESPITKFKNICNKLSVTFTSTTEDAGKIGAVTLNKPEDESDAFYAALDELMAESGKAMIKIVVNSLSDEGGVSGMFTWMHKLDEGFSEKFIEYTEALNSDVEIVSVSLINRIEVYLDFELS